MPRASCRAPCLPACRWAAVSCWRPSDCAHTQGAERAVSVPDQLERFKALPMSVSWEGQQRVLSFVSCSGETVVWQLANVAANRKVKGRAALSKKQQQERFEVPVRALEAVHLYVDF